RRRPPQSYAAGRSCPRAEQVGCRSQPFLARKTTLESDVSRLAMTRLPLSLAEVVSGSVDRAEALFGAGVTEVGLVQPLRGGGAAAESAGAIAGEAHLACAFYQLADHVHEDRLGQAAPVDAADAARADDRLIGAVPAHGEFLDDHVRRGEAYDDLARRAA